MTLTPDEQNNNIIALGQKLVGLGIKARFKRVVQGPVVTGYYFELEASESIRKVMNKAEDFALAMAAAKVMVQRMEGEIVVFVPNKDRDIVEFKDYLYWYLHDPDVAKQELPIPLGVDIYGKRSTFDLVDMPHCLVTGSTQSGKSVWEAAVIECLSLFLDSKQLVLYLCDTKKVDLPLFKSLPHVRTCADSLEDFHTMMAEIMQETRRRLEKLQNSSCRKIQDYHKMVGEKESMPYIVVMIDEFADLMDTDKAYRAGTDEYDEIPTVKQWIKNAAQICRAAGVHLICCTQRASAKIVDGDIKANLPCRITLRLPSQIDSRTVLGVGGAENLLGKGDMLVKRPEEDSIIRYHGPFVSMLDIGELVSQYDYIKQIFKKSE